MGNSSSGVSEEWIENRLKSFESQSLPDFEPLPENDDSCPKGGVLMKVGTSTMKLCHGADGADGKDEAAPVVTPLPVGHEKCSNGGCK